MMQTMGEADVLNEALNRVLSGDVAHLMEGGGSSTTMPFSPHKFIKV